MRRADAAAAPGRAGVGRRAAAGLGPARGPRRRARRRRRPRPRPTKRSRPSTTPTSRPSTTTRSSRRSWPRRRRRCRARSTRAVADAAEPARREARHARLIALYERELEVLSRGEPDKGRTALYQHEIGELTESRAGDEGAAVKAYAKALQSDATLKPNLWAIRRVFERRALWPNLQKLLDAEIRFAKTPEEKAELLRREGRAARGSAQRSGRRARLLSDRAVEASPPSLSAWMALEKIYTRSARSRRAGARAGAAWSTPPSSRRARWRCCIDLARLQESIGGGARRGARAVARGARRRRRRASACSTSWSGWPSKQRATPRSCWRCSTSARERLTARAGRAADRAAAARERAAGGAAAAAGDAGARARRRRRAPGAICRRRCRRRRASRSSCASCRSWPSRSAAGTSWPICWPRASKRRRRRARSRCGSSAPRRCGAPARPPRPTPSRARCARDEPGHLGLLIARERTAHGGARLGASWRRSTRPRPSCANSDGTPTGKPDPRVGGDGAGAGGGGLRSPRARRRGAQGARRRAARWCRTSCRRSTRSSGIYARGGKHAEYAALARGGAGGATPSPARAERLLETLIGRARGARRSAGRGAGGAPAGRARPTTCARACASTSSIARRRSCAEAAEDLARAGASCCPRSGASTRCSSAPISSSSGSTIRSARRPPIARRCAQAGRSARDRGVRAAVAAARQGVGAARAAVAAGVGRAGGGAASRGAGVAEPRAHRRWRCSSSARSTSASAATSATRRRPIAICSTRRRDTRRRCAACSAPTRRSATTPKRAEALAERGRDAQGRRRAARRWCGSASCSRTRWPSPIAPTTPTGARSSRQPTPHAALGRLRTAARAREPVALAEAIARLEPLVFGDGAGAAARAVLLDERADLAHKAGDVDGALARSDEALELDPHGAAAVAAAGAAVGAGRRGGGARRRAGGAGRPRQRSGAAVGAAAARGPAGAVVGLARDAHRRGGRAAAARGARADAVGHDGARGAVRARRRSRRARRARQAGRRARRRSSGTSSTPRRWKRRGGSPSRRKRRRARSRSTRTTSARSSWRGAWRAPAATTRPTPRDGAAGRRGARGRARRRHLSRGAPRPSSASARATRRPAPGARSSIARRSTATPRSARASCSYALYAEDKDPGPLVELFTHRLDHVRGGEDRVRLYLDRATLFHDGGDRDSAERDLRAALDLDPDEPEALRRLGRAARATSPTAATRRSRSSAATSRTRTIASAAAPHLQRWPSCYEAAGNDRRGRGAPRGGGQAGAAPRRRARRAGEAGAAARAPAAVAARGRDAAQAGRRRRRRPASAPPSRSASPRSIARASPIRAPPSRRCCARCAPIRCRWRRSAS